ncbi:hypothetical protein C2S51_026298 [Perilla frutescens var. frutescens]|nr:hypothetical protein C2S51_026298 [Perilla frutescens var. frutescens]
MESAKRSNEDGNTSSSKRIKTATEEEFAKNSERFGRAIQAKSEADAHLNELILDQLPLRYIKQEKDSDDDMVEMVGAEASHVSTSSPCSPWPERLIKRFSDWYGSMIRGHIMTTWNDRCQRNSFTRLWEPCEWLRDEQADILLNLLLYKSQRWPVNFPKEKGPISTVLPVDCEEVSNHTAAEKLMGLRSPVD